MPYEMIIPENVSSRYNTITSAMRGYRKEKITGIAQKNAPAFITVVEYREKPNTDYTYATKQFGAPTALSNKFFLQGITENRREKSQIIETFGDPLVLFFNEKTKVYSFNGTFLDANKSREYGLPDEVTYNWAAAFRKFYEDELRGTKLAENNRIAMLTVNNQVYMGYPIALDIGTSSAAPITNQFGMTWIIIEQLLLPPSHIVNSFDSAAASEEYLEDLKGLYSVNNTLSGATASRLEELYQIETQLIDELKDLENQLRRLKEAKEDPNDADTPAINTAEKEVDRIRGELSGIRIEILSLSGIGKGGSNIDYQIPSG